MKYNSRNRQGLSQRRSIRLKGYDYSRAGAYFITICCEDREYRFGEVKNDEMILNEYGNIAYNEWNKLPKRFPNFELDVFQIMPNHMHGIIVLNEPAAQVGFTPAQPFTPAQYGLYVGNDVSNENVAGVDGRAGASPTPATVGNIVGAYKSLVANACLGIYKMKNETMGKLWQRNYYERIIRNERSYKTISDYIINNPAKWKEDKFNKRKGMVN